MPTSRRELALLAPILLRCLLPLLLPDGSPDELLEAVALHIEHTWHRWRWPLWAQLPSAAEIVAEVDQRRPAIYSLASPLRCRNRACYLRIAVEFQDRVLDLDDHDRDVSGLLVRELVLGPVA